MGETRFATIKRILLEALSLLPQQRAEFVARACAGDPELEQEVLAKLAHEGRNFTLLEPDGLRRVMEASAGTDSVEVSSAADSVIGPYRLLRVLGEGAMGVVWLAEQLRPLTRHVALKIAKPGLDAKELMARFEVERQALALMNHPSIAMVIDAGETPEGSAYFVMEYVDGLPLTQYCDARKLNTRQRLELFCRVCEGVEHAHQKAVIHRDLKPSNILVVDVDGQARPKIIDFGIAKATSHKLTDRTMQTAVGQLIGTPEYMSPEQADLDGGDVDTRSDIYSLGVILYELLSGAQPFDSTELRRAGWEGMRRLIRDLDPPRPSVRVAEMGERATEVAAQRLTAPGRLASHLRGDLDWIAMRALEKNRERRYRSTRELYEDVRRHLRSEPVLAGPPTLRYRTDRFLRRNRWTSGAIAAGLLAIVAFGVMSSVQSRRVARERDRANQEAAAAQRVSSFLADMLAGADPKQLGTTLREDLRHRVVQAQERGGALPEQSDAVLAGFDLAFNGVNSTDAAVRLIDAEILSRASRAIDTELADAPLIAANLRHTLGATYIELGLYAEAVPEFETAVAIRRRELGSDHIETLTSRHRYGEALSYSGRSFSAMPEMIDVLAARRRLLGESDPETISTMLQLALALKVRTRFEEAEALYQEALGTSRRESGPLSPVAIRAEHGLGILYSIQGHHENAERVLRSLWTSLRAEFGDEDRQTLAASMSLGIALSDLGRYEEAIEQLRPTLDRRRRLLGDEHPNTIVTMGNLTSVLLAVGRNDEAESLIEEAVRNSEIHLSRGSHATIFVLGVRSLFYKSTQRDSEAVATLPEITDLTVRSMGPRFFASIRLVEETAEFFALSGRDTQARDAYQRLLTLRRESAAESDSGPAVRSALAWLLMTCPLPEFRDPVEALRLAQEACEMTDYHLPDYLDTLGLALYLNGDAREALQVQQNASTLLPDEDRQRREEIEARRRIYEAAVATSTPGDAPSSAMVTAGLATKAKGIFACHY